jgi:molybdenum cofactor cytidylyltransferase
VIAALLLAAGRSRRFGADKLVAALGDRPVMRWSAETLVQCTDRTYVVVPPEFASLTSALAGLDVTFVPNAARDEGMGSSIAAGVAALPTDAEAVVIALADVPRITAPVVHALVERWRATRAAAVAPRYLDGRGHPVLFDRSCFAALAALAGDSGARSVLEPLGASLELIDVCHRAPLDVDTPVALASVDEAR